MPSLRRTLLLSLCLLAIVAEFVGCTRARYRRRADLDSYAILNEKTMGRPWSLPNCFSIAPDVRSRFAQYGNLDDPALPVPAPTLYGYDLPALSSSSMRNGSRMDQRFESEEIPRPENGPGVGPDLLPNPSGEAGYTQAFFGGRQGTDHYEHSYVSPSTIAATNDVRRPPFAQLGSPVQLASWNAAQEGQASSSLGPALTSPRPVADVIDPFQSSDRPAGGLDRERTSRFIKPTIAPPGSNGSPATVAVDSPPVNSLPNEGRRPPFELDPAPAMPASSRREWQDEAALANGQDEVGNEDDGEPQLVPVPKEFWEILPENCLSRMFEFESIREEYQLSYDGMPPTAAQREDAQRLTLEDIIELALINSRNYQSQKEQLYRVALNLTRERFEYELRFTQNGLGTDADYTHSRNGGTTVNGLGVPTGASVGKALNTGGDLVARFANDVVLTFNGPSGFTADVGSDLVLDLSYSVLQRDIQFESLTQSERDVVYAARDFARFRKQFFVDLANQYYNLILTFRSIEIASQNYLSLVRGFNEADADYRATGQRSLIEVDQFEQNALSGRSSLISSCNGLEQSLDNLKLNIGLPPETPINLALDDLEDLTLRDETTVAAELVTRTRRVLETNRLADEPNRAELINGGINLAERMVNLIQIRQGDGIPEGLNAELDYVLVALAVEEIRLEVAFNREALKRELAAIPPAPPLSVFQRTMDLVDSILVLIDREVQRLEFDNPNSEKLNEIRIRRQDGVARANAILESLELTAIREIPGRVKEAAELLERVDELLIELETFANYREPTEAEAEAAIFATVDRLLDQGAAIADTGSYGLVPVEIDMDDAMLTALIQRFDLLNERGDLADTWRQIKLAGDDLRSILNLSATQVVRTDPAYNRAFDFTWDESSTNLRLQFDTPVNRRSQRNTYRSSLINYQQALRNLMELEDFIKFDIRNDLRSLQLGREQYRISVASAALAYERVVSTQLQLRLGTEGVAARDFLEAQQTYAQSLSSVAGDHVNYIQDRNNFFLDLESLYVDESGFWPELYNESVQPQPAFQFAPNGGPVYGELPPQLHYSRKIRRMNQIPDGMPQINRPSNEGSGGAANGYPADHR